MNGGFWIADRKNEAGPLWKRRYDEHRFQYNRPGDMLMVPFQCDTCWFVNLRLKLPRANCLEDDSLLVHIRRANLDAMWAKEPGTVKSVMGQEKKARELLDELGLEDPNYPGRDPWPI